MTAEPTNIEHEQAQLDAALDAALDELDDDDDDEDEVEEMEENNVTETTNTAEESLPKRKSDSPSSSEFIGPPRPPPPVSQEEDPEKLLAEMMQQLSTMNHPTGDADSNAFLGQFMQEIKNQFQNVTEETETTNVPSSPNSASVSAPMRPSSKTKRKDSTVDRTIDELVNDMAKPVQTPDEEDPLKGMMEELGMPDFSPDQMVEGMMKELLSKDLMYEPMKQVATKFPAWLEEKRETMSEEEHEKRKLQCDCFQKLVHVYETDPTNAMKLMDLMQDVQEYGQPPNEIIQEIAPGLELDEDGMPKLDGAAGEECRIM